MQLVGIFKNVILFQSLFQLQLSRLRPYINKKEPHFKIFVFTKVVFNLTNSLLLTVITQFTTKTTNSEKAIYFLPLISCSINKVKFHMFFTCKNFMVSDFMWKKNFFSRKWCGGWRPPCPPFPAALPKQLFPIKLMFSK